jgi:hypothetical protein
MSLSGECQVALTELEEQAKATERVIAKFNQLEELWQVETDLERLRSHPSWGQPTAAIISQLRMETEKRVALIESILSNVP